MWVGLAFSFPTPMLTPACTLDSPEGLQAELNLTLYANIWNIFSVQASLKLHWRWKMPILVSGVYSRAAVLEMSAVTGARWWHRSVLGVLDGRGVSSGSVWGFAHRLLSCRGICGWKAWVENPSPSAGWGLLSEEVKQGQNQRVRGVGAPRNE